MAPLLVYRSLREASDWMLNYYSEIGVLGQENIPREGPLLMLVYSQTWTEGTALNPGTMLTIALLFSVACHHNEVVDIGALCACGCLKPMLKMNGACILWIGQLANHVCFK